MNEAFLHYVWSTLNFDFHRLKTTDGTPVHILHTGTWNTDQGPDFIDAKIQLDRLEWTGNVEIHYKGDDWYNHGHDTDPVYNNVILHIVFEASAKQVCRNDGSPIPEIVLKDRISPHLTRKASELLLSEHQIPCERHLQTIDQDLLKKFISDLSEMRLAEKVLHYQQEIIGVRTDWAQLLWEEIIAYLGHLKNREVFRQIAREVPYKLYCKHLDNPIQAEALLMGTAGLLTGTTHDDYQKKLKKEWTYLSTLYDLSPVHYPLNFFRMRPANFPTVRLSQVHQLCTRFRPLTKLFDHEEWTKLLSAKLPSTEYWFEHNRFALSHKARKKEIGRQQKKLLLINCIIPLAIAYGKAHGVDSTLQTSISYLKKLSPEENKLTRYFSTFDIRMQNAWESQGLLRLFGEHCTHKKCLTCRLGKEILSAHTINGESTNNDHR